MQRMFSVFATWVMYHKSNASACICDLITSKLSQNFKNKKGNFEFVLEWFSVECRKTITKVITLVKRNICRQSNEPIRAQSKYI